MEEKEWLFHVVLVEPEIPPLKCDSNNKRHSLYNEKS